MELYNTKILFVLGGSSDPTKGGVSRVCDNLTKSFTSEGATVFIISTDNSYVGSYKESWKFPRPRVVCPNNIEKLENLQTLYNFTYVIIEDPQEAWIINAVEVLKGRTILIGHFHNSPFGLYSYVSRLRPLFLVECNIVRKLIFYRKSRIVRKHYQRVSNLLDRMVLLSDAYKFELNQLALFRSDQVVGIPNPFPKIDYVEHKKSNTILYVGRVANPQKRVFALLNIWKRLSSKLPEWEMKIVGDGPQLNECKIRAQKMKLERIFFEGHQTPDHYYNDSKILLMTSLYEGFPMTIVEAMQNKCVPIAFNSFSALTEIIDDGKSGIVVQPFSEKQFVNAVLRLALDEVKLFEIASECRKKSIQYEPSVIVSKWIALFNGLEK